MGSLLRFRATGPVIPVRDVDSESPLGDHLRRRLVIDHSGWVGVGIDEGDDVVVLEAGTGSPTTCIIGWPSEMAVQL